MSVYGGFATRLQETQYSGLVCKLISLLERRIVAALRGGERHTDPFDSDQWIMSFSGVYKTMRKMESQKYQQPKYSAYCQDLAQAYGAYVTAR